MNETRIDNKKISYIGEFEDKKLEKEFFDLQMSSSIKYIKLIGLILGILFFLFIIVDYFLLGSRENFFRILVVRSIFLIMVIGLYLKIENIKNYRLLVGLLTILKLLAGVTFSLVLIIYDNPAFMIHTFGLMIMILAIYLIPNRLINMLSLSLSISSLYFIFAYKAIDNFSLYNYSFSIMYTTLVIAISTISTYLTNYYKRKQYIANLELRDIANRDPLIGIYNRLKFNEELEKHVNSSKESDKNLCLVMLDIDNFKAINDEYGHLVGDAVIIEIATLIQSLIRKADILARWGGEEFVIILPETNKYEANALTNRIKNSIEEYSFIHVGHVTCSYGVVALGDNDDGEALVQKADKLLYEAKGHGKNVVMVS